MNRCHVYVRNGVAYVPTVAKTKAGFYLDIEPVYLAPANDVEALRTAITQALRAGNPIVETPSRSHFPDPVVLRHTNLKSWAAFERGASYSYWSAEDIVGVFRISRGRKRPDRGWEDDPEKTVDLPPKIELGEVAHRWAAEINQ